MVMVPIAKYDIKIIYGISGEEMQSRLAWCFLVLFLVCFVFFSCQLVLWQRGQKLLGRCGSGRQLSRSTCSPLEQRGCPSLSLLLALAYVGQHATLLQFTGVAEDGSWVVFGGLLNQTVKVRGSTNVKTSSR